MDVDGELLVSRPESHLIDSLQRGHPSTSKDIPDTDSHPSVPTLVRFAALVYTERHSGDTDEEYEELLDLPVGWRLLVTGSNSATTNGYFGAAYVHAESQQVVVAHRGTSLISFGSLFTDVFGICFKAYTECMNSALTFVDRIREAIHSVNTEHNMNFNLVITGHSLGGWLAQITAFTVKYMNVSNGKLMDDTSRGISTKTVVFDSPGAKNMLDQIRDDYYHRHNDIVFERFEITGYVLAPNRVNTCGAHVGTVNHIFTDHPSYYESNKFNWFRNNTALYNWSTHEIARFDKAFKTSPNNISQVLDWAKNGSEYEDLFLNGKLAEDLDEEPKEGISTLCKKTTRYKLQK